MGRIDELQKKYPNIPRDMVVIWETRRTGIRDSETVDKVSFYNRGGLYQSRDNDVTLKDIAKKRPGSVRPGFVLRAPKMYLKSGFGTRIIRDTESPFQIREEGPDKYALFEGEQRIDTVQFPNPLHYWTDDPENEPRTSKGNPVTSLVQMTRRCFGIYPTRYCEYFATGDQCKFCNFNSTQEDGSATGAARPVTLNLDEAAEAYKIIASVLPPLVEGRLVMGAIADSEAEAKLYIQLVEKLANATSYLPNIGMSTQPMSKKNLQRLKDAGLGSLNMNIEVWDAQAFEEICPGKAKHRGRERYLEAYQEAVEILGWGSVGTNMPPGISLMVESGHKTWQDARDSQIEGIRWLIQHGVDPAFETLVLGVGSVFGDNPANRAKRPPADYHLDLALAHHAACKEFGMYERMNRLLWCPLDCSNGSYAGELGMVEIAGDLGKWAATCVPDEDANWLGRFIESFKSPVKAE